MKTHELLIAIPTLNHPKLVMFYLSKTLDDALKYGIDICVFDASSDNKTEQIVQRRILEGYQNLYYKKYPENTLLEERCEDIYCVISQTNNIFIFVNFLLNNICGWI